MANPSHDLLPCPFCGGAANPYICDIPSAGDYIMCDEDTGCGVMISRVDTKDGDLIGAWNRRATPPSPSTAPEVDERTAFKAAARIAEGYGPGRPIVAARPSDLIRGRWEGEQAASANIARLIRERGALASRPAEVDDEGLPPIPAPKVYGFAYTAEQFRQGQCDAVAADRARRGLIGVATNIKTTEWAFMPPGRAVITCDLTVRSSELREPGRLWLIDPSKLRMHARGEA